MGTDVIQFGETRPFVAPVSKVFAYNGTNVTFEKKDSLVMVNATQMAKQFNKVPKDWLRTNPSKEFINSLSAVRHICPTDLVRITQGGNGEQGTWMQERCTMRTRPNPSCLIGFLDCYY